jgi:clan AA aspartic protease
MSIFRYPLEIGDPQGEHFEQVDALVDTGATFTVVPSAILDRLGVELSQRAGFRLADGAAIQRGIGETQVRIEGETFSTTVVFGEDDGTALLGVDPVGQRLIPTDALMMELPARNPLRFD